VCVGLWLGGGGEQMAASHVEWLSGPFVDRVSLQDGEELPAVVYVFWVPVVGQEGKLRDVREQGEVRLAEGQWKVQPATPL